MPARDQVVALQAVLRCLSARVQGTQALGAMGAEASQAARHDMWRLRRTAHVAHAVRVPQLSRGESQEVAAQTPR